MSGHTPGPWRSVFDADGDHAIFAGSTLVAVTVGINDLPREVDEANARLIAAAPDLRSLLDLSKMTLRKLMDSHINLLGAYVSCDQEPKNPLTDRAIQLISQINEVQRKLEGR